jgi:hypothetical protein
VTNSLELHEFDQIEATPGTALLRITAQSAVSDGASGFPVLLVDDANTVHRVAALPGPPDSTGLLQCAFPTPLAILEQPVSFALELAEGSVVELPDPTRGRASDIARQAAREEVTARDERIAAVKAELRAANERVDQLEQRLRDAIAAAAERADAGAQRIAELERELEVALTTIAELDASAKVARVHAAELEALRSEAQERIGELEAGGEGRADVEEAKADALAIARNYEQEAAARVVAEALAQRLELELAGARQDAEAWRADAEKARMSAAAAVAEACAAKQAAAARSEEEAEAAREAQLHALREGAEARSPDPDSADAPGIQTAGRLTAERAMAERQAANREALRARGREIKQRSPGRRKGRGPAPIAPRSKPDSAQPPDAASEEPRRPAGKPRGRGQA